MKIESVNVFKLKTDYEMLDVGDRVKMLHSDRRIIKGKLTYVKEDMIYVEVGNGTEEVIKIKDIKDIRCDER